MTANLSALVVDDETRAQELLEALLRDTGEFIDIQMADSGEMALQRLERFSPDIIFLDIQMPGKDGLSLLKDFQKIDIGAEIIFTTAYEQYALDAIRNHAFGYLLKPVSRKELGEAIAFFKKRQRESLPVRLRKFLDEYEGVNKIRINSRTGYLFIDSRSILFCIADGNYCKIQEASTVHFCSLQLGRVEEMFPPGKFVRLGRSLLVNLEHLVKVDRQARILYFERDGRKYTLSVSKSQLQALEVKQAQ